MASHDVQVPPDPPKGVDDTKDHVDPTQPTILTENLAPIDPTANLEPDELAPIDPTANWEPALRVGGQRRKEGKKERNGNGTHLGKQNLIWILTMTPQGARMISLTWTVKLARLSPLTAGQLTG